MAEMEQSTDHFSEEREPWVEPELAVTSLKEAMAGISGNLDSAVGYS